VKFFRSRRGVVVCAVLLLTLLFLVRPGANRLKTRITRSISLALGRSVDVASVRVRLLPQPGFDLENFVIHDDPAFGAEPMLRSREVTASLRWLSLLRGRLEIARLDFSEPSLNLVHGDSGHWNFENLVERAERIPVAPTAKAKSEKRPGFPYIDCSGARINFKLGPEKKPYALTEADFSFWQESENTWGMRLKARPVRSDFNLTDTGIVRVSGSWQRAANLRETPIRFAFAWDTAQLGQISKLAYGNDSGLRGNIELSIAIAGTAANSLVTADASADDFHRYDILAKDRLRLAAHCDARYIASGNTLSEITCRAPVGEGLLALNGQIENLWSAPSYDLVLAAQAVPAQSLLTLARHARSGITNDLVAGGYVDAQFRGLRQRGADSAWQGRGQAAGLVLSSALTNADIVLDSVPFALSTQPAKLATGTNARKIAAVLSQPQLQIGPFRAALGKPAPVTVQGRVGREGYDYEIEGEAQLQRLLQAAHIIGIPAPQPTAEGSAKLDLQFAGRWSDAEPARATGRAQLHAIRAQVRGFNAPLNVESANLTLTQDEIRVQNLVASAAATSWHGAMTVARPCLMAAACAVHFDLHADEIGIGRLNQLLNPVARQRPWYRALSSSVSAGTPYLMRVNAAGKLSADRIIIGKLLAGHATANVELAGGKLQVSDLQADVLGGRHRGEWNADFTVRPPQYSGQGTFQRVSLDELAKVMTGDWITGTAGGTYHASAAGLSQDELFASAHANVQVEDATGTLPHIALGDDALPLQMRNLTAYLVLQDGKVEVQAARLETAADTFHVTGTASLTQILDLRLMREDTSGFAITGTLAQPSVLQVAARETRAALKP
jgi:hypothetical protein